MIRKGGFKFWLDKLHKFLRESCGADYHHIKITSRSLQFNFKGIIDIDLLVSPNSWAEPCDFYNFLKRIKQGKGKKKKKKMEW